MENIEKKEGNEGLLAGERKGFVPLVTVVDFHHARGPEVEYWFGAEEGTDPAVENEWPLLPFMALSDGAHASTEDFSYFTLLRPGRGNLPPTSLFGISCTQQMDASILLNRPAEVTRSTVQKAVVVIADSPQFFGMLRERLGVVTKAWFAQREFTDTEILKRFQESLAEEKSRGELGTGKNCADPELDDYRKNLVKPTSLKTSDRSSLLNYMGLPLQIFGKGSLFGPYTPLQQLDILADYGTKSYIVGSTNSLLLQQRDRYSDILINLDDLTINITSASLRSALTLSAADRRWIDFITQTVNDTWDESNPSRPKTMGYVGSEEFIRLQFEEYLLSLISSVKCHNYLVVNAHNPRAQLPQVEGDPAHDFSMDWIDAWTRSENYEIWNNHTDSHLFDIVEPKHPCAGGLTIDDVQRRIAEQVKEMHLDERFAVGKEVLGRNLAAGKERASTVFNKLYADMEAYRESQRKRNEEARIAAEKAATASGASSPVSVTGFNEPKTPSVQSRAGAYIGSWGTWMGEKRKAGWGRSSGSQEKVQQVTNSPKRNSRGFFGKENIHVVDAKNGLERSPLSPRSSHGGYSPVGERPGTAESFKESIFDAEAEENGVGNGDGKAVVVEKTSDAPVRVDSSGHLSGLHEGVRDHNDSDGNGEEENKTAKPLPVSAEPNVWNDEGNRESDEDKHERAERVAQAMQEAVDSSIHS
ncbi:transporter Avl9 [Botrytis cinerea]